MCCEVDCEVSEGMRIRWAPWLWGRSDPFLFPISVAFIVFSLVTCLVSSSV